MVGSLDNLMVELMVLMMADSTGSTLAGRWVALKVAMMDLYLVGNWDHWRVDWMVASWAFLMAVRKVLLMVASMAETMADHWV